LISGALHLLQAFAGCEASQPSPTTAAECVKGRQRVAEKGQAAEITQFELCKPLIKKGLTVATNLHWHTLDRAERWKSDKRNLV
jgi:hypothetical protein